jgi:hypothetical protein
MVRARILICASLVAMTAGAADTPVAAAWFDEPGMAIWRETPVKKHQTEPAPAGWNPFKPGEAAISAAFPCVPEKAEADDSAYSCQSGRITYFLGTLNVREIPGRQTRGSIFEGIDHSIVGPLTRIKGNEVAYEPEARIEYGNFQGRHASYSWGEFELVTYMLANDHLVIVMNVAGDKEDLRRNDSRAFFQTLQAESAATPKKPSP